MKIQFYRIFCLVAALLQLGICQAATHTLRLKARPDIACTFNTDSASLEAGATISLSAYTQTGFKFLRWEDEAGTLVSNSSYFQFTMPEGDALLYAVCEYNPENPANPAINYWNKESGEVIVDDFTPGNLSSAITAVLSGSSRDDVNMITVSGMINNNDLGIINNYKNCYLLDLSRVSGITEIPSYAFDYTNLESVYLPATIEKIGARAFYDCKKLTSLTVYAMVPPVLESNVFTGVQEGLVVYVPSAAIARYQEAEVWKDFIILPIQEDIRSISVSLPEGTNASDYAQMWLELTNTKSGQRIHYVMTDRQTYTFANIIRNTTWNVCLRNERGDVFGQIGNVEVKDEDVAVAFTSLSKPQRVRLAVLSADGTDVTAKTQVTWLDAVGNYLAQSPALSGLLPGSTISYKVALSQELAMQYVAPHTMDYVVGSDENHIQFQLETIKQITLSGSVKDVATKTALNGAIITASQTFGGKYSKTVSTKTDSRGNYSLTISNVPTSLAISASDYISQTFDCDSLMTDMEDVSLPDVHLKGISGAVISLSLTYTKCPTEEGNDDTYQNWYADYNNVSFALYNQTKGQEILQYNVQYPQIVLLEEVDEGDVLQMIATSKTGAFMPVQATTTIDAEQRADAVFNIVELGKIKATFSKNGNASVVGSLYDANGKLLKSYDYNYASLTINDLTDGSYTLVTMGASKLFNSIYDLSQLPQTGLVLGADYTQTTVEVKSGKVCAIDIAEVPTLDESKLYYTGDNTSFTVNKTSIVAGNYLTLTAHLDFKTAYAANVSNVNLIVDLPETCEFVENSVMVGNNTSNYTLQDHRITIPMVRYTDRVRFCIIPTRGGEYAPSALAQFDLEGETVTQPIGSANYTAKDLSISVPATVAKTTIPVSGTAIGSSTIEIYDGDVLIGQTCSLANGSWSTTCEIVNPYNLSIHNIYAKVTTKAGLELKSENRSCTYDKYAIEVCTVTMLNTAHTAANLNLYEYRTVFDFQNPSKEISPYWYWPNYPEFTFIVDFTNNDTTLVKDVKLHVFTSDNNVVTLYPEYDSKQDRFVAIHNFSSNSLPYNTSVSFTSNEKKLLDAKELDSERNSIEELVQAYNEDSELIDREYYFIDTLIKENMNSDDIDFFLNQLDIIRTSYGVELNTETYIGMTEDEIEAVLNTESLIDSITNILNDLLELDKNVTNLYNNGSLLKLSACDSLTVDTVIAQGYEKIEMTDGNFIYLLIDNNNYIEKYVDFYRNTYIEIHYSTIGLLTSQSKSANSRNAGEWAVNCIDKINKGIEWINNLSNDLFSVYTMNEKNLDRLVFACQQYADCMRKAYSNAQISGMSMERRLTWLRKMRAAERSLVMAKRAASVGKSCLRKILRAVPVVKYVAAGSEMIGKVSKLRFMHESIPEPCENDQVNAQNCKNRCEILAGVWTSWFVGNLLADFSSDAQIASGAMASIVTAGTSLAATAWGIVQKVLVGVVKFAIDKTIDNQMDSLSVDIRKLKCKGMKPILDIDDIPLPPCNGAKYVLDPSGFVYEGVFSNRLEGVTATAYYKEMVEDMYGDLHENIVKWDAEEYAQENPLFTDENGYYRWDVPQGLWQVKFEKEGYETTFSEWLPVPPPQLDVNIAMTQNVQPNVKNARAYEDAVEVEFDKYMMPELLNTDNITVMAGNQQIEGAIELLNEEVKYEGETETYASKLRFNAAAPFEGDEITLLVNNRVKSYASIRMQDNFSQSFTIEQEIRKIVCDSAVVVRYGFESVIPVTVLPASASKGKVLNVRSSSHMILGTDITSIELDDEGKALIPVSGELPGTAALTFTIEGYDLAATTIVNVELKEHKDVSAPTASIASGSVVENGTSVSLSCTTEGATIYYTLDGSCPCDEDSRLVYTGPIIIDRNLTIKAMAVGPDGEESEIAEFTYFAEGSGIENIFDDNSDILVFPSPMDDYLTIVANGQKLQSVSLTSMSGMKTVFEKLSADNALLDVHSLPSGPYIIEVITDTRSHNHIVIKK